MQDYRNLNTFLVEAGKRVQTHRSDIAKEISQVLFSDLIPRKKRVVEASPVNISLTDFLPDAKSDLILLLSQCSGLFAWREAGFGKLNKELAKCILASEIIGPKGIFDNSSVRVGLLIQQEHTAYPKHWHSAEELYLVLNGEALWSVDDDPFKVVSTENFVHHKPNQSHSITTLTEPLLAMWAWTGDINGPYYSV